MPPLPPTCPGGASRRNIEPMNTRIRTSCITLGLVAWIMPISAPWTLLAAEPLSQTAINAKLFAKENLVAWCIVPFDSQKRSPEERAAMLEKLGIKRLAYDWRVEH